MFSSIHTRVDLVNNNNMSCGIFVGYFRAYHIIASSSIVLRRSSNWFYSIYVRSLAGSTSKCRASQSYLSGASTYNEWSSTKFLCYLSQLTTEEVGGEGGKVA